MISRREALTAVGLAVLAMPLRAEAQLGRRVYRVGFLTPLTPRPGRRAWQPFAERLRELGYVEGGNLVIEPRYSEGKYERLPALAAELVGLKPDVIVSMGTPATQAVRRETASIPIVMAGGLDPVEAGLVATHARPGGNVTGVLQDVGQDALVKTLQLLKDAVPSSSRVMVLVGPQQQNIDVLASLRTAASALGLKLQPVMLHAAGEIDRAFATIATERGDALLVLPNHVVIANAERIVELAGRHRIPAAFWYSTPVRLGGLLSYGVDWGDVFRRAATLVDKILKGANPVDLPIEQPTTLELVINLKTAKELGLTIAPSLLLRANEVID